MPMDWSQLARLGGNMAEMDPRNRGFSSNMDQFASGLKGFRDWMSKRNQPAQTEFQTAVPGGNPTDQLAAAGKRALGFQPRPGGFAGRPGGPLGGQTGGNMSPLGGQITAPQLGGEVNPWAQAGGNMAGAGKTPPPISPRPKTPPTITPRPGSPIGGPLLGNPPERQPITPVRGGGSPWGSQSPFLLNRG